MYFMIYDKLVSLGYSQALCLANMSDNRNISPEVLDFFLFVPSSVGICYGDGEDIRMDAIAIIYSHQKLK